MDDVDTDSAHSDDESSVESESSAGVSSEGSDKTEIKGEQESYRLTPTPKKRSLREIKDKRSPMKKITKTKDKSSKKETQVSGMDEQWQIIKSMRRRQESTLRAAEKEREEVRFRLFATTDHFYIDSMADFQTRKGQGLG